VSERAADVTGADQRDFGAGHNWTSFPDPSGRSERRKRPVPAPSRAAGHPLHRHYI